MEGFDMGKNRPPEVQRAIQEGDEEALRAMGKVGGRKSAKLSMLRADLRALSEAEELTRQEEILKGAEEHSEANRAGWDDDYRP